MAEKKKDTTNLFLFVDFVLERSTWNKTYSIKAFICTPSSLWNYTSSFLLSLPALKVLLTYPSKQRTCPLRKAWNVRRLLFPHFLGLRNPETFPMPQQFPYRPILLRNTHTILPEKRRKWSLGRPKHDNCFIIWLLRKDCKIVCKNNVPPIRRFSNMLWTHWA